MEQLRLFEVRKDLFSRLVHRRESELDWYGAMIDSSHSSRHKIQFKCYSLIQMDRDLAKAQEEFDNLKINAL
ncbi:hypothetical protein MYO4S_00290 [Serratia phage 4S]|nr:hypothetical protein MYO4S_00290 [Serratia phage 4S]